MSKKDLKGWNFIVYILIKNNFDCEVFSLSDLYEFEHYFKSFYPKNSKRKEKLRQTLQKLRDKGLLEFVSRGKYRFIEKKAKEVGEEVIQQELVYLLSNDAINNWVKIGRTNDIDRRLKELYNTSVPLPFKVEASIQTRTKEESTVLEQSIHNIIDTLNPDLRKNTEASKREFFKMSISEGKSIFELVAHIMKIKPVEVNVVINSK